MFFGPLDRSRVSRAAAEDACNWEGASLCEGSGPSGSNFEAEYVCEGRGAENEGRCCKGAPARRLLRCDRRVRTGDLGRRPRLLRGPLPLKRLGRRERVLVGRNHEACATDDVVLRQPSWPKAGPHVPPIPSTRKRESVATPAPARRQANLALGRPGGMDANRAA